MRHLPNVLTAARILMTPALLILLTWQTFWGQAAALSLFVLASVSDYLDGLLARHMKVSSQFGKFLDPLADKVLVLGTFAVLALLYPRVIPWWAVFLIAFRDVAVTGLRTWAEARGRTIETMTIAKYKTLTQLAFLFYILTLTMMAQAPGMAAAQAEWLLNSSTVTFGFLMAVVVFTLFTGLLYFIQLREVRWLYRYPSSRG